MRILGRPLFVASALLTLSLLSGCVPSPGRVLPSGPGSPSPTDSASSERRPNVLIVVTDDQRADTMEVMPKTLRWMRDGGVEFTNAFATTPSCCPSRASIFTGRMVHNHGVTHTMRQAKDSFDQRTTVQFHLQRAGYRTGIFGKYLNDWPTEQDPPFFDNWAVFGRAREGYRGASWNVDGTVTTVNEYSTAFVRDRAERFLVGAEEDDDRPWFLYMAPFAPHYPYTPEAKYRDSPTPEWNGNPAVFEENRRDKPRYVRKYSRGLDEGERIRSMQLRTLMSVDDLMDRVFVLLGELGESGDTLAFYLSDNGYLWGEHGRTRKFVPYTPSIEIPLFMRWPGRAGHGVTDHRLVANIDVAPTVMDAVGLTRETVLVDGRSLLGSYRRERLLLEYWATPYVPSWASVRTRRFQYIEYHGEDGEVGFREYYDLRGDPWQLENLLRDGTMGNEPNVRTLTEQLSRDRSCRGVSGPGGCP